MVKTKPQVIGSTPFEKFVVKKLVTIAGEIKFIRGDQNDMEDHLNKKIAGTEQRLNQKIAEESSRLGEKIDQIGKKTEGLQQIHPGGTHATI